MATLRYDVAPGREPAHLSKVSGELLPQLVAAPGVAAAHLLVADPEASGERTEEHKLRGGPANAVPRYVLIVEGWGDERGFIADMRERLQAGVLESLDGPSSLGIYRHKITVMPGA